jgi:hypothetical protein
MDLLRFVAGACADFDPNKPERLSVNLSCPGQRAYSRGIRQENCP